jgi:hypothetical protein
MSKLLIGFTLGCVMTNIVHFIEYAKKLHEDDDDEDA